MTMTPIRIKEEAGARAKLLLSDKNEDCRGAWGVDESLPAIEAIDKESGEVQELASRGCERSWELMIHDVLAAGDRSTLAALLAHPSFPFVQKYSWAEGRSSSWLPAALKSENLDMFWDIVGAAAAVPRLDGKSLVEQGMFWDMGPSAFVFDKALTDLAMSPENEGAVMWLLSQEIFTKDARSRALLALSQKKGNAHMIKMLAPLANCEIRGRLPEGHENRSRGPQAAAPLCFAAWVGDVEAVRVLLPFCNPRGTSDGGMTALMIAANEGHVEVVEELSKTGHCSARNREGETALMRACDARMSSEELVERKKRCALILARTSPVEAVNENSASALGLSIASRQWDLALILSEHEEAWAAQDKERNMSGAVAMGEPESPEFRALLEKFLKEENWAVCEPGSQSVPRAAERNSNPKLFDLLIGDAKPFDLVGGECALWLRLGSLSERLSAHRDSAKLQEEALSAWLEKKPEIPPQADVGELLALAIETHSEGWTQLLLPAFIKRQESGVEEEMERGDWPLSVAARHGRADLIAAIFPKNGLSHQRMVEGRTALMEAAERGFLDCVRALLIRDSGLEKRSADGNDLLSSMTALGYALAAGRVECAQELISQGASWSVAAGKQQGLAELLALIIQRKHGCGDDAARRESLRRCLGLAIGLMPENFRATPRRNQGRTILIEAAAYGDWESVQTILAMKPGLAGARDAQGRTALMKASTARSVECVRLLRAVEDVDERDEDGLTALFLAVEKLCGASSQRLASVAENAFVAIKELAEVADVNVRTYQDVSLDDFLSAAGGEWGRRIEAVINARRERDELAAMTAEASSKRIGGAKGARI